MKLAVLAATAATASAITCKSGWMMIGDCSGVESSWDDYDCGTLWGDHCYNDETTILGCTTLTLGCATDTWCDLWEGTSGYTCCDTDNCNSATQTAIGAVAVAASLIAYAM